MLHILLCAVYNLYPGILRFKFGELLKTNRSVCWTLLEISPKLELSWCFISDNPFLHSIEQLLSLSQFPLENRVPKLLKLTHQALKYLDLKLLNKFLFWEHLTPSVCEFVTAWTRHNSGMIVVETYSCRQNL